MGVYTSSFVPSSRHLLDEAEGISNPLRAVQRSEPTAQGGKTHEHRKNWVCGMQGSHPTRLTASPSVALGPKCLDRKRPGRTQRSDEVDPWCGVHHLLAN
jgi:hypothetical protein